MFFFNGQQNHHSAEHIAPSSSEAQVSDGDAVNVLEEADDVGDTVLDDETGESTCFEGSISCNSKET